MPLAWECGAGVSSDLHLDLPPSGGILTSLAGAEAGRLSPHPERWRHHPRADTRRSPWGSTNTPVAFRTVTFQHSPRLIHPESRKHAGPGRAQRPSAVSHAARCLTWARPGRINTFCFRSAKNPTFCGCLAWKWVSCSGKQLLPAGSRTLTPLQLRR